MNRYDNGLNNNLSLASLRLIVFVALLAYCLPWISTPLAALQLNAYDLAEWASLHPVSRAGNLPLLASFALRILPVLLIFPLCLHPASSRFERWVLPVILSVALLPPLDFFRTDMSDPNYRQQLMLSVVTLLTLPLSLFNRASRYINQIAIVFAMASCLLAVGAVLNIAGVMQTTGVAAGTGVGVWLLVGVMLLLVGKTVRGSLLKATSLREAETQLT